MKTSIKWQVCVLMFICLSGMSLATVVYFNNTAGDQEWSNSANWDMQGLSNSIPDQNANWVIMHLPNGVIIHAGDAAECTSMRVGNASTTAKMWMTGGSLTQNDWFMVGTDDSATVGEFYMSGGVITLAAPFWIGYMGQGHVFLSGGTINATDFTIGQAGGGGTIDISGGELIIDNDIRARINTYVANGWMTAFGGDSRAQIESDYDVSVAGKTRVWAEMTDPDITADPTPDNWGIVEDEGQDVQLSWLAGASAVSHDVYFGTTEDAVEVADINSTPVYRGRYSADITNYDISAQEITVGNTYYWRIDAVSSEGAVVRGDVWRFSVIVKSGSCQGGLYLETDLNKDCKIDCSDLVIFAEDWMRCNDAYGENCNGFNDAQQELAGGTSIRTDIRYAAKLGQRCLNSMFDADKDNEPYFYSNLRVDGTGELLHALEIGIPHVVGRCLWASMLVEETMDLPFPQEGLNILKTYCQQSFDNPDYLNSYIREDDGRRGVEFHNMREGLLGLLALIRGRSDQWAIDTAALMVDRLNQITTVDGHISQSLAEEYLTADIISGIGLDDTTSGRCVGPLVEYYKATGNATALTLAGKYAQATLNSTFYTDGRFRLCNESSGHVHSITSSLSGIALYALETSNQSMLNHCCLILDNGVPEYFSTWGWGDEVMPCHSANLQSRGEMNQTGDVIRTALTLGDAGYPEYYEMAECFLRSMLLPTQHREAELNVFMHENENPSGDYEADVLQRTIGGWAMQLPNDRMREGSWPLATLDITSGATHALCECWKHRVTTEGSIYKVNMLFDYEDSNVVIKSALPLTGMIRFMMKSAGTLEVRIPQWVETSGITLERNGTNVSDKISIINGYLTIADLQSGDVGTLVFLVPYKRVSETVDGINYDTAWWGNQIISIEPRGTVSPLPF